MSVTPSKEGEAEASSSSVAAFFVRLLRSAHAEAPPDPAVLAARAAEPCVYDINRTEGTFTPESFCALLEFALPFLTSPPPHSFLDFGCGDGIPILLTACLFGRFERSIGIEVSPTACAVAGSLHRLALELLPQAALPSVPRSALEGGRVAFFCEDALSPPMRPLLASASVIFANATAFSDDLLQDLLGACQCLAPGALLLISRDPNSGACESPFLEPVAHTTALFSWGTQASVGVLRRRPPVQEGCAGSQG